MPAITSTIPDVKAAIVAAIDAHTDLDGVQVTYGHPGKHPEREFVFVGGTVEWDEEWASLGASRRTERYTLELYVNVLKPGLTQQQATERAFVIFNGVGKALLADPTLGGRMLTALEIQFRNLAEGVYQDEGREAQIVAGVRCDARVTRPT